MPLVASLVMPFAARAIRERSLNYQYQPESKIGVFRGSAGLTCYSPEQCAIYPTGNGQAILQAQGEGDDNAREWTISGVPGVDSFGWGQEIESGQELGQVAEDLQLSLVMQPVKGGNGKAVNPLPLLKTAGAAFVDIDTGAVFKKKEIVLKEPEPQLGPAGQPSSELGSPVQASDWLSKKPQYTSVDMMIAVGVTAGLTGLIVYGFSRSGRRR